MKHLVLFLFFLTLGYLAPHFAAAQQSNTITGTVTSEAGDPLQGATVTLRNQRTNTVSAVTSNETGNFSFSGLYADEKYTLIFEYVGYQRDSITNFSVLNDSEANTIIMRLKVADAKTNLDEVIVIGYGTQKKSEMIGSVSQVSAKDVNSRAVGQLSQAIAGQMPGVAVIQRSGQPGTGAAIQVRGVGSFGASPSALILVDGIPTASFNDIDPNDVENISVLKDASTAAIYGARAANGVILVTTKTGSMNKMAITYNGYVGSQRVSTMPEYVSSWEYARLMNEAIPGSYTDEQIEKYRNGSDPDNYPNSDFIGSVFKKGTLQTGHNISLSYGNAKTQYLLSAGYMYQNGIVAKNDYNRYNFRFNIVTNLNRVLKLTTRISAIQTHENQPATPATLDATNMAGIISNTVRYPSIYAIRLSNGDWGPGVVNKGNPVSWLESQSFYQFRGNELLGNLRLDWQALPELKLSAIGGYTQGQQQDKSFLATQRVNANIFLAPSSLSNSSAYSSYKTMQALAEFNKKWNQHSMNILGGYSFEESYSESLNAARTNLPSNDLPMLSLGDPSTQTNNDGASEYALQSLFGRLQYNFMNRYLAEGVLRYDGSSRFPVNQKYALFPGIAVGWRVSEEKFIKNNLLWLNDLKLKASYGTLGNQNIGNYPYQNLLYTGYNYPFGGVISAGAARTTITDTTLHWESTRTKDIGFDATILKNRLNFGVTYFDKYTYNILASPGGSVSNVLGYTVGQQNSGSLSNKGWEFILNYRDRVDELQYWINSNLTVLKNTILDLGVANVLQPNGLTGNPAIGFIGYPYSSYYGYVADGLFVNAEDVTNWTKDNNMSAISANPQPGDIRYKDISGPGGKPDGKVTADFDRVVLGTTIPKYSFGSNLGVSFKGIDISVLLQGVAGVKGYLNNYAGWAFYLYGSIQRWQADGHWTAENPDRNAVYPRLEIISNQGTPNTLTSSFWTLNGSYLRIKNIQLGYNIPTAFLKAAGIKGARLNIAAENLHTWSKYRKGWDPEINTGGSFYPILKNYTVGLNLNF